MRRMQIPHLPRPLGTRAACMMTGHPIRNSHQPSSRTPVFIDLHLLQAHFRGIRSPTMYQRRRQSPSALQSLNAPFLKRLSEILTPSEVTPQQLTIVATTLVGHCQGLLFHPRTGRSTTRSTQGLLKKVVRPRHPVLKAFLSILKSQTEIVFTVKTPCTRQSQMRKQHSKPTLDRATRRVIAVIQLLQGRLCGIQTLQISTYSRHVSLTKIVEEALITK